MGINYKSRILTLIFLNKTSFYEELLFESKKIKQYSKIPWPWVLVPKSKFFDHPIISFHKQDLALSRTIRRIQCTYKMLWYNSIKGLESENKFSAISVKMNHQASHKYTTNLKYTTWWAQHVEIIKKISQISSWQSKTCRFPAIFKIITFNFVILISW